MSEKYTNKLSGESSLYLQQHAHNPVNWYPWSDEAWAKAKNENKLVLVSIGYSSCHWCHVMENECFVDTATARIMNENFICIKVDREERPDIDQIYMAAVQLMTGSGGWPLNCFTLPNGKPVYGGTYFPKAAWQDVLIKLNDFYKENPDKAEIYADELTQGIHQSEIVNIKKDPVPYSSQDFSKAIHDWKKYLDNVEGGPSRTPKFPLPGNYRLLLRYAVTNGDEQLYDHVKLTLDKMAFGGIYDHLAGGFSRYSTDSLWKIPHFEKMLYDNAQLISLYSSAYKFTKNELYKQVATQTLDFLKREMSDGKGGYFSAIDADSEGEEGKFYVWTKEELMKIKFPPCGNAAGFEVFSDYFNVNETGHWEKNNYILLRKKNDEEVAAKFNVSVNELTNFITQSKMLVKKIRDNRKAPMLDTKIITSWNALQISALCDAYQAFGNEEYKLEAIKCAENILTNSISNKGFLLHVSSQKDKLNAGYLEDYSFTISGMINLYQITFDERWLQEAKKLADEAITAFYSDEDGFFWFNSTLDPALIVRKKEISDNVIPASNSEIANAFFLLGHFFDDKKYSDIAEIMLGNIAENVLSNPSSNSNWANLMMNYIYSFHEIVVSGVQADSKRKQLSFNYLPNVFFAGSSTNESTLPLLDNRFQEGKTLIYICKNKTCGLPIENTQEAITLIKNGPPRLVKNVNYSK